jgi:3-oxoacyl-[acyl-carrier protein] reductase
METQVAMITGAGRGIGKTLAIGFAKKSFDLILTSRTASELEETKKICESLGRKVVAQTADVGKYEDVQKLVQLGLTTFGKIDVLINNAGYSRLKYIQKFKIEDFQAILTTNVIGVYNCTHAVVPSMLDRNGGAIINTGSLIIYNPGPRWSAYSMSKSALIGFTESLSIELKPKITVNTIMPNIVDTPLFRMGLTEEQIKEMGPMNPEALIPYYFFFTTEEAKKVTGIMVNVDIVEAIRKLIKELPDAVRSHPSWELLEPIVQQKLSADEAKIARKCRKLIDYLVKS